jgi:hypothetical protein
MKWFICIHTYVRVCMYVCNNVWLKWFVCIHSTCMHTYMYVVYMTMYINKMIRRFEDFNLKMFAIMTVAMSVATVTSTLQQSRLSHHDCCTCTMAVAPWLLHHGCCTCTTTVAPWLLHHGCCTMAFGAWSFYSMIARYPNSDGSGFGLILNKLDWARGWTETWIQIHEYNLLLTWYCHSHHSILIRTVILIIIDVR